MSGGEHPAVVEGWSQDLLSRLLEVPPDSTGVGGHATEALVLRSYQLRTLRLGDPGRATHLVSILRRMLPPESRLTEDRPANTLHVLSSVAAQQAVLEFVGAMDATEGERSSPAASGVPDEIRKALESLAATRPDAEKLAQIINEASERTEERMKLVLQQSQGAAEQRMRRMLTVGGLTLGFLVLGGGGGFLLVWRRVHRRSRLDQAKREAHALALMPAQSMEAVIAVSRDQQERTKELQKLMESFSIAYQADRQRSGLMMEAVAKKHGELTATLEQMTQLRREMGENAGKLFLDINREAIDHIIEQASTSLKERAEEVGMVAAAASQKMEETANRLEVQNARAEALAAELERTQKEVDSLFEKLKQAQLEASEQRRLAYEKSAELAKREAALAGLSLLMQEPMSEIMDTLNVAIEAENDSARISPDAPGATAIAQTAALDGNGPNGPNAGEDDDGQVEPADDSTGECDAASPQSDSTCQPTTHRFRILPVA